MTLIYTEGLIET